MAAPRLFDRDLARARLARAHRQGFRTFLLERVAEDLVDRLAAVARRFELGLDLGSPSDGLAARLRETSRVARLIRAAPVAKTGGDCVADEERLPFRPAGFDLVVSALALQGVNDLPGALAQIRAALAPDGLFLACLLAGETLTELRQSLIAAEIETLGGAGPRVAPFADLRDLGGLLQRVGFALPVIDMERLTVRYASPVSLLHDLRGMGLTNSLIARPRGLRRVSLMRALAHYQAHFADPDGRVRATFDIGWLSGWAPHESQQKPLRPGSAKARLADALLTVEFGLGEKVSPDKPR